MFNMETGSAIFIFIFIIVFCYMLYDSIPSKYTKLEENFGGFINKCFIRFEYEKSPLHTIVYGGTGTRKTYFDRQYLMLDQRSVSQIREPVSQISKIASQIRIKIKIKIWFKIKMRIKTKIRIKIKIKRL